MRSIRPDYQSGDPMLPLLIGAIGGKQTGGKRGANGSETSAYSESARTDKIWPIRCGLCRKVFSEKEKKISAAAKPFADQWHADSRLALRLACRVTAAFRARSLRCWGVMPAASACAAAA